VGDQRKRGTSLALAVGILALALVAVACGSNPEPFLRVPSVVDLSPTVTLDPDNPVVIGDGPNTERRSGDYQIGIDATDVLCDGLRRDLNESIDQTLSDLRNEGMPAEYMPTRTELQEILSDSLRANGCSGF